ncbi:hypothetical protein BUALT_Bualt18G0065700 [Buddleja alternifolia]|uniref:Uncharacterized protein n=1 Tax=Buddleja alternifolia TaxID=168488 RepID=A0AAV6W3P1_9LAMI|nr:hypothetical protein BUALT_Bualt18G0065700 [Buddleja alternifolia]
MVQTLEAIKGGGGSIKVGATGTISALMSRELEPTKSSVSVSSGDTTPRKLKPRTSSDEASSSSTRSVKNHRGPETVRRKKQSSHQIPILTAGDVSVDGTPIRQKPVKKGPTIVEIVDIKCGNPDKAWVRRIISEK